MLELLVDINWLSRQWRNLKDETISSNKTNLRKYKSKSYCSKTGYEYDINIYSKKKKIQRNKEHLLNEFWKIYLNQCEMKMYFYVCQIFYLKPFYRYTLICLITKEYENYIKELQNLKVFCRACLAY